MIYNAIQFIGYELDTLPDHGSGTYRGNMDARKDLAKRCAILKGAIEMAASRPTIKRSSGILKVFMAPEFFFRSSDGAYPIDVLSEIMGTMKQETQKEKYTHWLFVYGTAVGAIDHGRETEILNCALVQKGGQAPEGFRGVREYVVYKEYMSPNDFIRETKDPTGNDWYLPLGRGRNVTLGGQKKRPVIPTEGSREMMSRKINRPGAKTQSSSINPTGKISEVNRSGIGGGSIFTIDHVTFGLETCLDHARERLAEYIPLEGENLIQVQLIPSAGIPICHGQKRPAGGNYPDSLAGVMHSLAFNVDGKRVHSEALIRTGGAPRPIASVEKIPVTLPFFTQMSVSPELYFKSLGKIAIYKEAPLPPRQIWEDDDD